MCWYKKKDCFKCGKRGHIKSVCENVKHIEENESESEGSCSESEGEVQSARLYQVGAKQSKVPPIPITVQMNGKDIDLEVDTGAPFTMISRETAKQINCNWKRKLKDKKLKLTSFTGHNIEVLGCLCVDVQYNGLKKKV